MGHYYSGMLDIMTDVTLLSIAFGTHVELLEVDELSALRRRGDESDLARRVQEFRSAFDVQPDCPPRSCGAPPALPWLSTPLSRATTRRLAYYYKGPAMPPTKIP